jgi:hypothetical protein
LQAPALSPGPTRTGVSDREDHWHGAAPKRFMTHIAMQEADDQGSPVAWGEHVTEEKYGAAPPID